MLLLKRSEFIKLCAYGLTAVALESVIDLPPIFQKAEAVPANRTVNLDIIDVLHEMIDNTHVYSWAFSSDAVGPAIPGPVIFATEGDMIDITINNKLDENHAFAVMSEMPGAYLANSGYIAPGQSSRLRFQAPDAGTYMYLDPLNFPLHRVLGLHGVLIVLPASGNTPYGNPSPAVQQLFDDLGSSSHFPGVPWSRDRTKIWVFSEIDPVWNEKARFNQPIDLTAFRRDFLPRYYTINGRSGIFSAHDPDIIISGLAGEPTLIRNVNVGMAANSPHIHANHGYMLSVDNLVQENVWWIDTWTSNPGGRYDVLYPMIMPPDIPQATWDKLRAGTSEEGFPENPLTPGPPGFPMYYPMHCHLEMSQTAAGGNYPMGMVTHIEFHGTLY